jgi:hypothetical protein
MIIAALALAVAAVPAGEQSSIFTAAGYRRRGSTWHSDCDQPGPGGYEPGAIEAYRDMNGDGRPEAVVTEGSGFCYGNTGTGFVLLAKAADGGWSKLYQSPGVAEFLATRGADGMPDLSIGGPGFCFLVVRWNGKAYVDNRHEYEGKPCRP